MLHIANKLRGVCPIATAALLLLARNLSEPLGLPAPAVAQIITATGVSRAAAYEWADKLAGLVSTLARPRGRPPKLAAAPSDNTAQLTQAVLGFVMRHPGCVHRDEHRQRYSDAFRRFVLEQRATHASLDVEAFSAAVGVPLGTLKDWLREPPAPPASESSSPAAPEAPDAERAQIQTVLEAWQRWDGSFRDFCHHVRRELHVPFGRALVSRILHAHGVRRPTRRGRRGSDELALRGAFRTFFPGAQWVGDGMQVPVVVDGKRFTFNVELHVDAHTAAVVGSSVREQEDAAAVTIAFEQGVATTDAPPLALLVDNRPSNHAPEVDAVLGDTIRIRATLERPQNKGHVEGAFGLFSQVLPPLVLDTRDGVQALAQGFLTVVVQLWACTTNHRPRANRGGRSRVELYAEQPSAEQIEQARHELHEIAARQERARLTLEARRRPEVLALLDAHFDRLGLVDPERHIRIAIAAYPLDAIVAAIAIFEGKRLAGTLPDGADARYLNGIVRNIAAQAEGEHVTRRMLELRLEARDRMLAPLVAAREVVCAGPETAPVCAECVDRALATQSPLERAFWLDALADVIRARPEQEHAGLLHAAARRIHATFAVSVRERHDAVRVVASRLVPLA